MSTETPATDTPSLMDTPVDQLPAADAGKPAVEEQGDPPAGATDDLAETHTGPLDGSEGDGNDEDDKPKEPEGAPETYDAFTMPEGFEIAEDKLIAFTEFAKAKGLTQAEAQSQIELATSLVQEAMQAQAAAFTEIADGWRQSVINDPELGGANLAENLSIAAKARDQFGTPELKKLLDDYRLGDNPELVRFFTKVGKAMSDDNFVPGGQKTATPNFYTHPTSQPKA
jgi:hypothetical protein